MVEEAGGPHFPNGVPNLPGQLIVVLVQITNSHSLGLKTVNSSVTEMEIAFAGSPEQSSLPLTRSLKLFITQTCDDSEGYSGEPTKAISISVAQLIVARRNSLVNFPTIFSVFQNLYIYHIQHFDHITSLLQEISFHSICPKLNCFKGFLATIGIDCCGNVTVKVSPVNFPSY